eukprot:3254088-Rhodomonas_salina.1
MHSTKCEKLQCCSWSKGDNGREESSVGKACLLGLSEELLIRYSIPPCLPLCCSRTEAASLTLTWPGVGRWCASSRGAVCVCKVLRKRLANIQDRLNANCYLLRLDEELLHRYWPADRVVSGLKVCKLLRRRLTRHPRSRLESRCKRQASQRTGSVLRWCPQATCHALWSAAMHASGSHEVVSRAGRTTAEKG